MRDRKTEAWQRRHIQELWKKVGEIESPQRFTLPSYVNVETSPSEEPLDAHEKVKKRKSLKYVDDRAEVAETDEDSSPVESDIDHASVSLSSSSSHE